MSRRKPNAPEGTPGTPNPSGGAPIEENKPSSWLMHNPELIEAAGRVNFASRLGQKYSQSMTYQPDLSGEITETNYIVNPSFGVIYYAPSVGYSADGTSAINLAANGLSSIVRTKISGSRPWDPNDLMIQILALSSIYDALNVAVRAYGLATYYNAWDVTAPKAYLRAMGFEPDSIMNNMAYANGLINKLILKMGTFSVPASIKYVVRHAALTSTVYADGELVHKAQKYFFQPVFFWKYAESTEAHDGGHLVPVAWVKPTGVNVADTVKTVDEWYAMVDDMINQILVNSDFWIIDGDIRKTFEGDLLHMKTIGLDYMIEPVYDVAISSQMMNMTMPYTSTGFGTEDKNYEYFSVFQRVSHTENCLIHEPKLYNQYGFADPYAAKNAPLTHSWPINFHWSDVTPDDVATGTQLTILGDHHYDSDIGDAWFEVKSCGFEIPLSFRVFGASKAEDGSSYTWGYSSVECPQGAELSANDYESLANALVTLSRFDWHPAIYLAGWNSETSRIVNYGYVTDLDNWTMIDKRTLQQIHEAAVLSYFGVPMRN